MKLICTLFVLGSLGILIPKSYADPVLTVNAGVAGGILAYTSVGGLDTWIYTDTNISLLGPGLLQTTNQTFTAIYSDLAGVPVLNVTDLCASVDVLAPSQSCSALAFTFTDAALGTPVLASNVSLLGALGVNLDADAVGLNVGASIGGGSADIGFSNPAPAPTPEPGTLTLLGTGLLGIAGVMRKRISAV